MSEEKHSRKETIVTSTFTPRHGQIFPRSRFRNLFSFVGAALVVVLVATASIAGIAIWDLARSVKPGIDLVTSGEPPPIGAIDGEVNLLLVGSDSRADQAAAAGEESGGVLNDVNILLHISADHLNATAISIPRDMVVPYADCPDGGGGWTGPINGLLSEGGLPCIVLTVSELTGLQIPYAALVGFDGVVQLSNAVGGVDVCLAEPMEDAYTGVTLSAGAHTLSGQEALLFLRSRHGVGDGSDLGRISSQQAFMSSLIRKLKSAGTLTNPLALFGIAKAVTSNMTLSTSLNSIDTLASIALALKNIPLSSVTFVQFPGNTGGEGVYAGKVQPDYDAAAILFAALQSGQGIQLTGDSGRGTIVTEVVPEPSITPSGDSGLKKPTQTSSPIPTQTEPSPTPTAENVALPESVSGQTANQVTCTKGRSLEEQ